MTDLLELAARVEGLKGPDREVDAEIALVCGIVRERDGNCFYGHRDYSVVVMERDYYDHEGHPPELPAYTASLDAAMTLVPKGHTVQLSDWDHETLRQKGPWQAIVLPFGARGAMKDFTFTNRCDHTATPSLALLAAALRARAHGGGEG
jgi:hypothetical protein